MGYKRMNKIFMSLFLLFVLLVSPVFSLNPDNWSDMIEFTSDPTNVDATLSNFPILVTLNTSHAFVFNTAQSLGQDIRFTQFSNGTTEYYYEIENWDSINNEARIWVFIPDLSSVDDTVFYMPYGNASVSSESSGYNTWFGTGYSSVYHFNNSIADSLALQNLTNSGSTNGDGIIAGARSFDGNDHLTRASFPANDTAKVVSLWINATTLVGDDGVRVFLGQDMGSGTDAQFYFRWVDATDDLEVWNGWTTRALNFNGINLPAAAGVNEWIQMVLVFDGSVGWLYINGELNVTNNGIVRVRNAGTGTLNIGRSNQANSYHKGLLDELRLGNVNKTAEWVKAEYYSQTNQLLTYDNFTAPPIWSVLYNNYTTPVFQLSTTSFGLTVNTTIVNITNITNVGLVWDGVVYNSSFVNNTWNNSDGIYNLWNFNITDFPVRFVSINDTGFDFYWTYSVNWTNNTLTNTSTSNNTQNIYWNNWISSVSQNGEDFFENEDLIVTANVFDLGGGTRSPYVTFNNTNYTSSLSSSSGNNYIYTTTINVPTPTGGALTESFIWNFTLSYTNGTLINSQISSNFWANSTQFALTNCSEGNSTTVTFTFYDEEARTSNILADMDIALNYTNDFSFWRNSSFEFRDVANASICIYPANAELFAFSVQSYWYDSYDTRGYFLCNASISNSTNLIGLYLLNNTFSTGTTFYITDSGFNALDDVVLKLQRYYIGIDSFITVAMAKTDQDGIAYTYVRAFDTYYRRIIEDECSVLQNYTASVISSTDVSLIVGAAEVAEFVDANGKVRGECSYTNSTGVLACQSSDASGLASETCLAVTKLGFNNTDVCNNCVTTNSPLMTCTIPEVDRVGNNFFYNFTATLSETRMFLESGHIDLSLVNVYGLTGVVVTFFLVLTAFFAGLFSPPVGILFAGVAVVTAYYTGMLLVEFGALMSFLVVMVIGVWKTKKTSVDIGG